MKTLAIRVDQSKAHYAVRAVVAAIYSPNYSPRRVGDLARIPILQHQGSTVRHGPRLKANLVSGATGADFKIGRSMNLL